MVKVGEYISEIRKSLNLNTDDDLSSAYLFNKGMRFAELLIRRDSESRRIYRSQEEFQSVDCFELSLIDIKNCTFINIPNCKFVMKSKLKLPAIFSSSNSLIMNVFSLDESVQFYQTTPMQYSKMQSREFRGSKQYFWITDEHLIVPGNIKAVKMYILAKNSHEIMAINSKSSVCTPFLEASVSIPDWLVEEAIRLAVSDIAQITKRIPKDENTNETSNIKQ